METSAVKTHHPISVYFSLFLSHTQRTEVEVVIVSHPVWWTKTQTAYTIICLLAHSQIHHLANSIKSKESSNSQSLYVLDTDVTDNLAWLRSILITLSFLQTLFVCVWVCATIMSQHCSTWLGVCVTMKDWHLASPHSSYTPADFGAECSTWDWYTVLM